MKKNKNNRVDLAKKDETIKKWEKCGLLEGLTGSFDGNIAKIFEAQKQFIVKEHE